MPLRSRDPEHREESRRARRARACRPPTQRRRRSRRRARAAASGTRARASRQLPKAACSSRKIPIAAASRDSRAARLRRPAARRSRRAPGRGTRAGSRSRAMPRSTSSTTAPRPRPRDVGGDVDAPRDGLALDDGRASGATPHVATSPSRTWPPSGVSISRSPDARSGCCAVPGAPRTTTSKTFCCSKRLPTSMPESSVAAGRRTSPGLMPYRWAAAQVDLDLRRSAAAIGELDARIGDAVDPRQQPPHRAACAEERRGPRRRRGRRASRSGRQHVEVGARRRRRLRRRGVDVADRCARRWHAVRSRIAVDDALDRGHGRVVVGVGVELHPELAGVDVDDLVTGDGAPEVRRRRRGRRGRSAARGWPARRSGPSPAATCRAAPSRCDQRGRGP